MRHSTATRPVRRFGGAAVLRRVDRWDLVLGGRQTGIFGAENVKKVKISERQEQSQKREIEPTYFLDRF